MTAGRLPPPAAVGTLVALLAGAFAQPIFAEDGLPLAWSWRVDETSLTISIQALDLMTNLDVNIRRHSDRRDFEFEHDGLPTGHTWDLDLPAPARTSEYTLVIEADFAGLQGRIEDRFEIAVLEPMDFEVDAESFDSEGHRFTMTMTQPAGSVELTVRGDTGELLAERTIEFDGEPPGTPLIITWNQPPGRILTLDVRAIADSGSWASRQYIPWSVEFDAAYVHFETGSAEIPAADEAMLSERLREIQATADRVQEWVTVKLYVAGYTDTVGSNADNQRLSESRASSIAQFFRREGARFPIYFQGFGESALAVPTGDDVDEPANRRSIFILSNQPPPNSASIPRSDWRPLD